MRGLGTRDGEGGAGNRVRMRGRNDGKGRSLSERGIFLDGKASVGGCLEVVRPGMPRSRMKPRMAPLSSFAHTTSTSAIGEFVIQLLEPVSIKLPSGCFRARVAIPPGSEP